MVWRARMWTMDGVAIDQPDAICTIKDVY